MCNQSFNVKNAMATHMKKNHTNHSIVVKCDICQKDFANKNNLKQHTMEQHELIKPYQCKICQQSFTRNWLLKTHIKTVHEHGMKNPK